MSFGGFLKKLVFFIPLVGGWYASKNPSSREAINLATAIITAQYGPGFTRSQVLDKLDVEMTRRGLSAELRALARAYAEQYMNQRGFK